jgi:site-specific recombinase XerD
MKTKDDRIKHLTAEQLESLMKTIYDVGSARDLALFLSIYHWAMRASEAAELRVDAINWDAMQAKVVGKKDGRTADLFIVDVKGQPHMSQEKALRRYFAERKKNNVLTTFVFESQKGGDLSPDSVNRLFKKYVALTNERRASAGLPLIPKEVAHVHCLRHSFCTLSFEAGMSLNHIAKIARHRSLATTAKYEHASSLVASQLWQKKVYEVHR